MIVRRVSDVIGTDRDVATPNWASRRLLLKQEGMGFSLHETTIFAGTETFIWYKHHLEAVFCVEGEGEVELLADGSIHPIRPGTVYALDRHDKHLLRARTDMRMLCVFNPPLTGQEVHDQDGVYPLVTEDAA
ncbi:MAG: ectoine synthase [Pseudomonadota bacterium]